MMSSITNTSFPSISDSRDIVVFTSPLSRNKETARLVCEGLDKKAVFLEPNSKQKLENGDIPVYVDAALNERKYGELEGKNKDEVKREFGEGQVHLWRRSWDIAPPSGESLKDVYGRTTPFFQKYIKPELSVGKNVLVVASHNSLRALAKYLEKIPDDIIADFEIPFGGIIVYELGQAFNLISKENL